MSYISRGGASTLTANEQATITAIEQGNYFVYDTVPTGTINGVNTTFTLPSTPNPVDSVRLFLNGQALDYTTHFSVSGTTITMVTAPLTGMQLYCPIYTVAP